MLWEFLMIAALTGTGQATLSTDASELNIPIYRRKFPVSRAELFDRVDRLTLKQCSGARSKAVEKSCISVIDSRLAACKASSSIPEKLLTLESFKEHVEPYLRCSQPVQVCKGIEIHSETDALQHCI